MSKTNLLLIRTPEGIVFSQLLAGPLTRFAAWLIDVFCIFVISFSVNFVLAFLMFISPDLMAALSILLYFVISIGFSMVTEWYWRGQTPGKRMLRLRVVDAEGLRLHFSQIVIRNLLRFVDMLPATYLVGGIACLVNRRAQRLGDIAANTVVIRVPKIKEPDLAVIQPGKFNSLREYPHLEVRLRQRVFASEASLGLQALLRRDSLEPRSRIDVFSEIADLFRSKVQFPAAATEGLTDEQYVRNVLDLIYGQVQQPRKPHNPTATVPDAVVKQL